jgi:MerR family transcriptional regulator, light-induced transcriptional regulator
MVSAGYIRIGELSRRTGVSPELLRAWERRYGLFEPERSPGRFRLYAESDVSRVLAMRSQISRGLSAAEAARVVLAEDANGRGPLPDVPGAVLSEPLDDLRAALAGFDEAAAHAALDRLLASLSFDSFLRDAVLPILRELGDGWERGEVTVAQEHFASNLLRGRLLALGRGWGRGMGRHALLAAPPGEQHDMGLVILGLALRDRGWRVTFLGADTPIETIVDTARRVAPEVVVLSTLAPLAQPARAAAGELARNQRVVLAGGGISAEVAVDVGAEHFADGPIEAATRLAFGSGR